ncbi:hypothetical protein RUM44_011366 [Polyplax serrata]|uniref:Uncharacterized protein n=1 Tax=Polyplax serrata TaxID=468196 RepID=A0ABR1APU2_POLSC
MASFRTGFKIFGELSIKQGLGRIRSFSEDRKPGRWLPEDQWAVRQPGSTCPEPCDKKKKPPKPSKSWLSVCKDPEVPLQCDVRHSNCPPPPVKSDGPWYSLDNLIPKKKQEKPPPLRCCREEMKRRELHGEEEEVCENIRDNNFVVHLKPDPATVCTKPEPCPAPVVTLCCPLPKELDIMLWCGQPSKDSARIAQKCQSDKLPYQEFRPQKVWKPMPFSLPNKSEQKSLQPCCNVGPIAYAEFKQVDVPKPLYTRYKSVELTDCNFLFCMIDAKCPDEGQCRDYGSCVAITSIPNPNCLPPDPRDACKEKECPTEKRIITAGSCRPVRLKNAPKYTFRPKPTKLIEKRVSKNPCAQNKTCDSRQEESDENDCSPIKSTGNCEPPKVLTGTLTKEPQCFERCVPLSDKPPKWMSVLCGPGVKATPLVPPENKPLEPDTWCSETDGLKFYDSNNEGISPKPPPDPYKADVKLDEPCIPALIPEPITQLIEDVSPSEFRDRFVLMPESYNIKNMRVDEPGKVDSDPSTVEKFIEAKTAPSKKCSKSYPPMKENILYDLQRMCPSVSFDPSKLNAPCRKPVKPECPQPPKFCRSFSTLSPATFRNLTSPDFYKLQRRTECGDSSGKCKVRPLLPKPKECPEKPKPADCAEVTLPCCPKSRIPPSCSVRRPLPPCKKKLPPQPSFSECSKDPPPCPKMTECNCWEKKPPKK